MPDGIKYSTTVQTNSLQKGNVSVGIGNVGPTATTNFYSAPVPTPGKYIVSRVAASGVPNFFAPSNDAEMIKLARQEGATGANTASLASCLAWFATQTNYFVANIDYPSIVTNGLICNLDANFCSSYPTTGTTWYDTSGNGNNGYLNSSQFVSNNNSGSYLTNLNNESNFFYFTLSDTDSLNTTFTTTTGGWTIEEVIWTNSTNYPEADAGSVISDAAYGASQTGFDWNHGIGIDYFQFGQSSNTSQVYEDTVGVSTSPYNQFNTWRVRTMIWDRGNNFNSLYLNGTYIGGGSTPNTAGTSIYDRGTSYIGTLYGWKFYGRRGSFRIYNRVLSSSEILQNYNAITYLGSMYNPANSATAILESNPKAPDGYYWINTNLGPRQLYCLMSLGGWMGMTGELCPQSSNVLTSASWETNTEGRLQASNSSILNVNVVETGCGGTSNYQLQNPSTRGLNYTQAMLLIQRVSTIGQCSDIVSSVGRGYYTGPEYTGTYTSYGMCNWADSTFANVCCDAQNMAGLKPYWVMLNSGTNPSLYYQVQCAGGSGQHYHMWFIK
jgi:hypothetical protein